jgi:hypothetical protein
MNQDSMNFHVRSPCAALAGARSLSFVRPGGPR